MNRMKKLFALTIALALVISFSGCRMNLQESLTTYVASFTMSAQYEFEDRDENATECVPTTPEFVAETIKSVIISDRMLNLVAEVLNDTLTAQEIRAMLDIEIGKDTSILTIRVISKDSQLSLDIARAIAKLAPEVIMGLLEPSRVQILDEPKITVDISVQNLFR